jgi:RNA polymerase sigma-70 factor (ECF subfamily)
MDEATLKVVVQRAGANDAGALADLYREFHPRVFGLCRYMLGSREEAEDAASEIFARLQKAMKSYEASLPFPRWLLSVTSHYCVDLLRKRRVEQRLFETASAEAAEPAAGSPSPLEELLASESRDVVRQAIENLGQRYRLPLVLRYYSDLGYDEIAAALGLTRANVAILIFRAKQELRLVLARKPERQRAKE